MDWVYTDNYYDRLAELHYSREEDARDEDEEEEDLLDEEED